jgi:c-di-GMP-binding flagellar brake protein YcgR
MPPDASASPSSPSSPSDRREYYRITVSLPISLQPETDTTENELVEKAVNLSAGGIGVTLNQAFAVNTILSCTLLLPGKVLFKSYLEVMRVDPIPYPLNTYRLHGRFIRMANPDRELLIRHIIQLQREHLNKHYSA